jgi:arsenate reductase
MAKLRVLFVCTYQGVRARVAEEFAKRLAGGKIDVFSSGFESGRAGDIPLAVMKEVGIDLIPESPITVYERYRNKEVFDYVITICHEAGTEQSPIFRANVDALYGRMAKRLSWSILGFNVLEGTEEEKLAGARKIRDQIRDEVVAFLSQLGIQADAA